MTQPHAQSGYSLVEALVAISVLLIAIVGPMTIAAQGIKSSQFALEQNTAFFLAQEGIEAIFAIRNNYAVSDVDDGFEAVNDHSWDWLDDEFFGSGAICASASSCDFGIDFSTTDVAATIVDCSSSANCKLYLDETSAPAAFTLTGPSSLESPYTRVITMQIISPQAVEVKSTVTWESHVFGGAVQTVQLTTYLFDSNYETP